MGDRLRITQATIVLVVVADDGEDLTPIPVDPITITGRAFLDLTPAQMLADLQAQFDAGQSA